MRESRTKEPIDGRVVHLVACRSHIGLTHRKNQDAGGAWSVQRVNGVPASLVVVADGVSSGATSEQASRLVVDLIRARVKPLLESKETNIDGLLRAVVAAASEASRAIAKQAQPAAGQPDATTVVAAVGIGTQAAGVWCGDSRIYGLRAGSARRLTRDHSWAEGMVQRGLMSAEEAARDARARMITRWLGPQEGGSPGIEAFRASLKVGDALLCCSDGLYAYFEPPHGTEKEMAEAVRGHPEHLERALEELERAALRRGGHDDITAAVMVIGGSTPG